MSTATDAAHIVPPAERLRVRLRKGVTWNLINTVFNQGSTFVVNVIIANLLGRQIFGEYAIILSTVLTLSTVAQLATGYTATRYVAEFRSVDRAKVGRILGLCSLISVTMASIAVLLLLVSTPWLATIVLKRPDLALSLMIGAGFVFCTTINGYLLGALAGLESYRALGQAGIITGSSYIVLCVIAVWLGGLNGALVGLALSSLLQLVVLSWFLRAESSKQKIVINYHGVWQEKNILLKFTLPAALSGFVSIPLLWLASAFLVRQHAGYEQMALFSAASSFRVIVLFLPNILHTVGMTIMNNHKGLGEGAQYRITFRTNIVLTAASVLIGALFFVLFGPWLLSVFGRSFSEGYPVLLVLMLGTLPEALAPTAYQIILSREKIWLSFFAIVLPHYGAMIVVAFFLTPLYGAVGLAVAYATGWIINLVTTTLLAWQYRGFSFQTIRSCGTLGTVS